MPAALFDSFPLQQKHNNVLVKLIDHDVGKFTHYDVYGKSLAIMCKVNSQTMMCMVTHYDVFGKLTNHDVFGKLTMTCMVNSLTMMSIW